MGVIETRNKMGPGELSELQKGASLLTCMQEKLKNKFVSSTEIREICHRGGEYTREVLEKAADLGIIERDVRMNPVTVYRIDPINDVAVCPYEPEKPFEQSICYKVGMIIEENARLRCKLQNVYQ